MNGGQPACALQMLVGVRAYPRFNKRNDGKWSCKIATSKLRGNVYRRECRGAPDCGPVRSNEPTTRVATWMSPCHSPLGAQKLEDEELWWELVWCAQAGYLMGCMINSPTEESKTMNLVGHHMYSLLDVANEPAGIAGVRLVQLRNPWGRKEYNGPWCDGSPEWHTSDGKKIAEGVGQQDKTDGTFWMPWETFVLLFTFIEYVPARLNRYVGGGKEQRDVVGLGGFFDFKKQSESGDALQPILLSGRKGMSYPGAIQLRFHRKGPMDRCVQEERQNPIRGRVVLRTHWKTNGRHSLGAKVLPNRKWRVWFGNISR